MYLVASQVRLLGAFSASFPDPKGERHFPGHSNCLWRHLQWFFSSIYKCFFATDWATSLIKKSNSSSKSLNLGWPCDLLYQQNAGEVMLWDLGVLAWKDFWSFCSFPLDTVSLSCDKAPGSVLKVERPYGDRGPAKAIANCQLLN